MRKTFILFSLKSPWLIFYLFGIFYLGSHPFHRSPAPSISPPVNPGVLVLPSRQRQPPDIPSFTATLTPPPRPIPLPQTAPVTQPVTPFSHITSLVARSEERQSRLHQPMTRIEFQRLYGRRAYESWKWRWNGAKRNERR